MATRNSRQGWLKPHCGSCGKKKSYTVVSTVYCVAPGIDPKSLSPYCVLRTPPRNTCSPMYPRYQVAVHYITQASPLSAQGLCKEVPVSPGSTKCKQRSPKTTTTTSLRDVEHRRHRILHLITVPTPSFLSLTVPAIPCAVGILSQAGQLIRLASISKGRSALPCSARSSKLQARDQTITAR